MVSLFFELGLIRPISCTVIYLLAVTGWVSLDHILFYILFSVASFILRVFFFFTVLYEVLLFIVVCRISRISQIQWKPFLSFSWHDVIKSSATDHTFLHQKVVINLHPLTLSIENGRARYNSETAKDQGWCCPTVRGHTTISRICEDWHLGEGITRRWRSIAKKL